MVDRIATRTAEYGFEKFTVPEAVASHGPFDSAIAFSVGAVLLAVVLAAVATPGLLAYYLFFARLSRRYSPLTIRFGIVPIATILFWVVILLLVFSAGCGGRVFLGTLSIPVSLYEGTSQPVHLMMQRDYGGQLLNHALEASTIDQDTRMTLSVPGQSQAVALQVELQAPEVVIGGDRTLSQNLDSDVIQYDWVLNFNNAGTKVLSFIFRLADRDGRTTTIGHIDRNVDVNKLGFLTKYQAAHLSEPAAVLTPLVALVGLIKPLAQRLTRKKKATVKGFSPSP